jgi:hypothetical protein
MHRSTGILRYSENPFKLIVEADDGIAKFYRAMIPKYYRVGSTRYTAHISVVRQIANWDVPMRMEMWRCYEGLPVEFEYESYVYNDETYYWLNCYSAEEFNGLSSGFTLERIRTELGLTPHDKVSRSPDGRHKFHMTIGNTKL